MKRMISCAEVRQLDLIQYLQHLGHQPQKIRGNDYWYLSPLREGKTASFKVNRKLNVWYDHGMGKGGNLVDFGVLLHGCTVAEFLQNWREKRRKFFLFTRISPLHKARRIPMKRGLLLQPQTSLQTYRFAAICASEILNCTLQNSTFKRSLLS